MSNLWSVLLLVILIASSLIVTESPRLATGASGGHHPPTLQVNVTTENGSVASYHQVYVVGHNRFDPYVYFNQWTNDTGIARSDIPSKMWGNCTVYAADSNGTYVSKRDVYIEPEGEFFADLQLGPALEKTKTVSGTLRNFSNDAPLKSVDIDIMGLDTNTNGIHLTTTTGNDGKFSFDVPEMWKFILSTHPAGFYGADMNYVMVPGKDAYSATIWLDPLAKMGKAFSVRFHESDTGTPLNGTLTLTGTSSDTRHGRVYHTFTMPNSTGWFQTGTGPGEYKATLEYKIAENVTCRRTFFINDNGTGAAYDIPVVVPDFRSITVSVLVNSVLVASAPVYYSVEADPATETYRGYGTTGPSGKLTMGVPEWTRITITGSYSSAWFGRVVFIPSTGQESITIAVVNNSVPSTKVHVTAVDEKTGYGLVGRVQIGSSNGIAHSSLTNETGNLDVYLAPGVYSFHALTTMGSGSLEGFTVPKGMGIDVEIPVTRSWQGGPDPIYTMKLVDGMGDPVKDADFQLVNYEQGVYISTTTDASGVLAFSTWVDSVQLTPMYSYSGIPHRWAAPWKDLELDGKGGPLEDFTVHATGPMSEVDGFVKDKESGAIVPGAAIYAISYNALSGGTYTTQDDAQLFYMSHGSDLSGFYRFWSKGKTVVSAQKAGYFPYSAVQDGSTRADSENILMERIPDRSLYVNGTLTDEDGSPISGTVKAADNRYPGDQFEVCDTTDGAFSLQLYPGIFTIFYTNTTLYGYYTLSVSKDVAGLHLRLVPKSPLDIIVSIWNGSADGIYVQLQRLEGSDYITNSSTSTDADGSAQLWVAKGMYRVLIEAQKGYAELTSDQFVMNGWTSLTKHYTLVNATTGILNTNAYADGGPFSGTLIVGVAVNLLQGDQVKFTGLTGDDGHCIIKDIPFGLYNITMTPSVMYKFIEGVQSGYYSFASNVTIGPIPTSLGVALKYTRIEAAEYLNITMRSPSGTGVSLNAPVIVQFDHALNRTKVIEGVLTIDPNPGGISIGFADGDRTIIVTHDTFLVNTTYTVRVMPTLFSVEGYPMYETGITSWNFTTGSAASEWELYSAVVSTNPANKTVTVTTLGMAGIDVFVVIDDIGSFKMAEIASGSYAASVHGSRLQFDTSYDYHFSNVTDGPDRAPSLAGTFKTGVEPVTWSISSATVKVDKDKGWDVILLGGPGQDVFIVIDGVGSFKLTEVSPGRYETTIPGSLFKWGKAYPYHFSPTSGGPAPIGFGSFSGSVTMGSEPKDDTDWSVIAGITCLVLLIMIVLIAVILVFAMKKKSRTTGLEE